ncbi:MAG: glycosyltransferase [Gemmatimonadaceae bacterium]
MTDRTLAKEPSATRRQRVAELSVVVPSVNGMADLDGCLAALEAQRAAVELEVLVVDRCGEALRLEVARRYPLVRVIAADSAATIPQLRALAFAAARAEVVAVIEDHVIVREGWARALLDAIEGGAVIVGGSVENGATERLVDWAAFLCEYSHCIEPIPAGPSQWLTGNNVAYRRDLLERYRAVTAEGKWENRLHDAVRDAGETLLCRPDIVVGHKKHYTIGEYLSQRFLYARSYAAARMDAAPLGKRLAYGIAACALPPVLLFRIASRVMSKRRHRAEMLRSIPLLGLFATAWAAGEVVGYVAGGGDALSRVR